MSSFLLKISVTSNHDKLFDDFVVLNMKCQFANESFSLKNQADVLKSDFVVLGFV